ncbi:hypothetical protein M4578_23905 [Salipiger sp. P9]|uniref:hypothetical protein n=1 Tax=Salipiger pentaromativorans TaxID=2943193 RepID=UPI002157551E|nr:hypothetical protein [Salipiger pentaromativorans]MCR8550882.1 hypothetical protein [Salipiger pentaromativorans]
MSMPIEKIVFTGDFLRPSVAALRPTQHENIHWLAKLLEVPVQMATGLPCEIVHWDNNWVNQSRLDRNAVASIYEMFWQKPTIHNWPKLFAAETLPGMVEDMFLRFFGNSLVIGFEIPPYLVHFLNRHDIAFIDCSLSPVRFLDDLLFEASASSPEITEAIRAYEVPEALIRLQAGVLSSNVAKANPQPPRPNSLLLILQTSFDKVVIENGRFTTVLDHYDRLLEIAKDYDHVLIKEHPLEPQKQVLAKLQSSLPDNTVTTDNFYRLVSHHNLTGVAALSSSCVLEARYFGKTGHYLIPGFSHDSFSVGLEGINIGDAVLMPDFWRDALAPAGCEVTPKDGLHLQFKPNRFRQQLRNAWGYNQIDTDIPVRWAT